MNGSDLRVEVAKALYRSAPARREIPEPDSDWWREVPEHTKRPYLHEADAVIAVVRAHDACG